MPLNIETKTKLLPIKTSSDDYSEFRHGFVAEALLPQAQSALEVSHDTTRLIYIYIYIYNFFKYPVKWQKCYHPGWQLTRTEYRTCFHTLSDEKKKYIYIYTILLNTLS